MNKKYTIFLLIFTLLVTSLSFNFQAPSVKAEDEKANQSEVTKTVSTPEEDKKASDSKINNFQEGNKDLIVKFKEEKSSSEIKNILSTDTKNKSDLKSLEIASTEKKDLTQISVKNDKDIKSVISQLKANPNVESVSQNYQYQSTYSPNSNPNFSNGTNSGNGDQWYLKDLNSASYKGIYAESAWSAIGTNLSVNCASDARCGGDPSVKIAVIDTGVNTAAPDFVGTSFVNQMKLYYAAGAPLTNACETAGDTFIAYFDSSSQYLCQKNGSQDDYAGGDHGTKVASVIAMKNNSVGGVGVAYNTSIMPISIPLDSYALSVAVRYAKTNGAKVINLSIATPYYDSVLETEINSAIASGVTVVASSGNCGNSNARPCFPFVAANDPIANVFNPIIYPAAFPGTISVGATNADGTRASYSTFNQFVDLVAPVGGGVMAQNRLGAYVTGLQGTSFSAPQVAGAVGLLLSSNSLLSPSQIDTKLKITTDKINEQSPSKGLNGAGKINVCRSLDGCGGNTYATKYFYPWNDSNGNNTTWNLISNPSNSSQEIRVVINVGGITKGVYLVQPGQSIYPTYTGNASGPLEILVGDGQTIYTTQRAIINGSFNEVAGISASGLTTKYFYPWNDSNGNNTTWNLISNPSTSSQATQVTIKLAGVLKGTYTIQPGESIYPVFTGPSSGPVEIESTNSIPFYTTQRAIINGSFNEVAGISASGLTTKYFYPWNDSNGNNTTWNLISNPSTSSQATQVTIKLAGVLKGTYTIQPGESIYPVFTGPSSGPVEIESTNSIPFYTTQRAIINGSFNEVAGISASGLTTKYFYPWNDSNGNNTTWNLISNPSTSSQATQVTIKLAGVLKGTYTIQPGESIYPVFTGPSSGPVEIESTNSIPFYTTQRAIINGSFNEFPGI